MPLSFTDAVLESARVSVELALSDPVRARWTDESSCEGMTVGGLAHHLTSQVDLLIRLYAEAPAASAPTSVLDHYRQAPWANAGVDDEVNVRIRTGADEQAAGGPQVHAEQVRSSLDALPAALARVDDDDPVLIPWQGWSLTAADFAVTRLMEMVVHADDLAASVDLDTPAFPTEAVRRVVGLLAGVAVDRHGQAAVVRTLSRPQRAPASVSAF
ncbi:MAG: maleylpyruvate isomerase N-terminal domain-containing protein [Nocardioides sp.]